MSITVVIGANTHANFRGESCIISVNWSSDPGRQDAFCLGSWTPNNARIIYKPQQTMSFTLYSSSSSTYSTLPSLGCEVAGKLSAGVSAGTCEGSIDVSGDNWQVNSYSYSKESKDQPAQETWSLINYIDAESILIGSVNTDNIAIPTYVIRGITQGQCTDETTTGVNFSSTFARSSSGSVSAGSQGKVTTLTHGIVSSVGGGKSSVNDVGTGSASIPLTPLYI